MTEGLEQRLTYRVLDQNTGVEVINPLPHVHRSSWTIMALQPGSTGGGTLGSFTIPLYNPLMEEYRAAKSTYDLLTFGQRIEGYVGNVASGVPKFSGVITGLRKTLGAFDLTGEDSLWWLRQSLLLPGEQLATTLTGDAILAALNGTFEVVSNDDFSGGLSNYTQTPGSQWTTTTDPAYNLSAVQCSTVTPTARAFLINTAVTGTVAQWQGCRVSAIGTIVAGTDTAAAGELAVVAQADSTGANCLFGRAQMRATSGTWAVDAEIWVNTAGTVTRQAQVQNVFTGLASSTFRCEVTLIGSVVAGVQFWRLLINGRDPGCTWSQGGPANASRSIGLTFLQVSGGSPKVYVDRLTWQYRNITTPRFKAGAVSVGTRTLGQTITAASQTQLDMWTLAMSLDGWYIRKNAAAGYKSDTYDFSAAPGTDLSGSIRFEEGVNLEDVEVSAASETYSTDVRMQGTPGGDSGGVVTWPRIGTAGDMVLTDTVTDVGTPGFSLLVQFVRLLQARAVSPWQAKSLTVVRDALTADRWRELDYVTLHAPSLNISNLKVLVLGYTWAEGALSQQVLVDQYAEVVAGIAMQRLKRAVSSIGNTYATR